MNDLGTFTKTYTDIVSGFDILLFDIIQNNLLTITLHYLYLLIQIMQIDEGEKRIFGLNFFTFHM
jgi:hypothetical protein